ncbi:WhiB family transcriptional regulator [Streptomyces lonarensis]|uniref:WhiB family transcriptional regulator n=2 Tax=Streptomyces lonarensis TaxID=700599 RepID=A0A7X6HX55_9ACTN|nr:WhiB family transcriptional regulator [Streptomyces lonarensis]
MWFSETDYYRAAAICRTCPVLAECAEETARDEAGRVPAYIQGVRAGLLPGARRRAAATATAA